MQSLIEQKHASIDELDKVCEDNDISPTNVGKLQGFLYEVIDLIEDDKDKWQMELGRLHDQMRDNPDLWENAT